MEYEIHIYMEKNKMNILLLKSEFYFFDKCSRIQSLVIILGKETIK